MNQEIDYLSINVDQSRFIPLQTPFFFYYNMTNSPFESSENIQKKEDGQDRSYLF